ncbi:hypothetical protein DDA98_04915 [Clostridium perfringens]|nr:phage terminase small subunit-related protein [Clostridium perfringens]PVE17191.1 hypothetical protein DDA98_04915 [Clostridium perfringens]
MDRERSPNRDKAFEIYKDYDGDIKLIDIAKELNIKYSLIRKWKSQDNWDDKLKVALPISNSNVTNQKQNKINIKKDIKEPIVEEVNEVLQNSELTDRQRLFCIYYINCFNASKAYKKLMNVVMNQHYLIGTDLWKIMVLEKKSKILRGINLIEL